MAHLWSWLFTAVWPNLLASLLWAVPAFVWHHRRIARRLDAIHARIGRHQQPGSGSEAGREVGL